MTKFLDLKNAINLGERVLTDRVATYFLTHTATIYYDGSVALHSPAQSSFCFSTFQQAMSYAAELVKDLIEDEESLEHALVANQESDLHMYTCLTSEGDLNEMLELFDSGYSIPILEYRIEGKDGLSISAISLIMCHNPGDREPYESAFLN